MLTKRRIKQFKFLCCLLLIFAAAWPGRSPAAPAAGAAPSPEQKIKQVVGDVYIAMRKLEGEVFYRHVDMSSVTEGLVADAEALVRGLSEAEMAELVKISPLLTSYIQKGDYSAARIAARNMLTIDTARWFNMSAKGKIVSAFAGDSGVLLNQFRQLSTSREIHYKGIKYIQVQGGKAVVALTIQLDRYRAEIQPIGRMELENGVWRLKKILNASALVKRIQALDRAKWIASAKAKKPRVLAPAKASSPK